MSGRLIDEIKNAQADYISEEARAAADIIERDGKTRTTICGYDKKYAREHKANKYFVPLAFFPLVVLVFSLEYISDALRRSLGAQAGYYAGMVIMLLDLVLTAWVTVLIVRMFPFLSASGAVWHIVEDADGITLIRQMPYDNLKHFTVLQFEGIASVRDDRWVIYYIDQRGSRRKQTVARAYPKLDEFFEKYAK